MTFPVSTSSYVILRLWHKPQLNMLLFPYSQHHFKIRRPKTATGEQPSDSAKTGTLPNRGIVLYRLESVQCQALLGLFQCSPSPHHPPPAGLQAKVTEEEGRLRRGSIGGGSGTRNFTLPGAMHLSAADKPNCRRVPLMLSPITASLPRAACALYLQRATSQRFLNTMPELLRKKNNKKV